jgi:predicted TIM-barrel enzyme
MYRIIKRILNFHWFTTLILMGVFALLFGLSSLNIFVLLSANFELVARHGTMALIDGALRQLFELLGYGYLSIVFYVLFKAAERALTERIFA